MPMGRQISIGKDEKGNAVWLDIETHQLVAGQSGSGKSIAMTGLILELLRKFPESKLYLLDLKQVEFALWEGVRNVEVVTDIKDMLNVLTEVDVLMNFRYKVMKKIRSRKWAGEHTYVFIDELGDVILNEDKQIAKQIRQILERLARMGRAAGIHLIVATQYPTKEVIPMQVKMNSDKLCLKCKSDIGYRVVMDKKYYDLRGKGDAVYEDGLGNVTRFQVNYYDDDTVDKFISTKMEG